MAKIAVYSRYYHAKRDLENFSGLEEGSVCFYSDSKITKLISPRHIVLQPKMSDASPKEMYSEIDYNDIIERCRLLRNIDRSEALRRVNAYYSMFLQEFSGKKYDYVISQAVDNYVLHLLCLLCDGLGVRFIGISGSFFPERTYLTRGSEACYFRAVKSGESGGLVRKIKETRFRQDYFQVSQYSLRIHVKKVLKYKLKLLIFYLLRNITGESYNYHWEVSPFTADRKRLADYPSSILFKQFDPGAQVREKEKKLVIYMPLSFTPEMTTDYWIKDKEWVQYEERVLQLIRKSGQDKVFYIKDHFHMLGMRSLGFYRELSSLNNVINIDPAINNAEILESRHIDMVLIGAGSTAIEAAARGRFVYTYAHNIYWRDERFNRFIGGRIEESLSRMTKEKAKSFHDLPVADVISYVDKCMAYHADVCLYKSSGKDSSALIKELIDYVV